MLAIYHVSCAPNASPASPAGPASTSITGAESSNSIGTFPNRASSPSALYAFSSFHSPLPPFRLLSPCDTHAPTLHPSTNWSILLPSAHLYLTTDTSARETCAYYLPVALAQDTRKASSWIARRWTCALGTPSAASALRDRAALHLPSYIAWIAQQRLGSWIAPHRTPASLLEASRPATQPLPITPPPAHLTLTSYALQPSSASKRAREPPQLGCARRPSIRLDFLPLSITRCRTRHEGEALYSTLALYFTLEQI